MKVLFFGTDGFAAHVLEVLGRSHEVLAVVTVPDAPVGRKQELQETPVAVLAQRLGLKTLKPASLKKDLAVEPALRAFGADAFVVCVYSKIIPQNILDIPPKGNINVHPSLLPLYRGPAPIRTPLINGDTKTGVSIMLMDEQVDHGPLLAAQELEIAPSNTNVTLTERLAAIAAPLLVQTLTAYAEGSVTPLPQDHNAATFTKMVTKEDGKIDWSRTAQEIYNQWRALQPWPGIYTTWNDKLLKVIECFPVTPSVASNYAKASSDKSEAGMTRPQPGTALPGGLIACGQNTYLQINKLQLEGKQSMDIKSFLNGNQHFAGNILQ